MDPFKPPRKGPAKRPVQMGVGHIAGPSPPSAQKPAGPPPSGRKQHGLLQTLNKLEQESEDRAFELIRLRVRLRPAVAGSAYCPSRRNMLLYQCGPQIVHPVYYGCSCV